MGAARGNPASGSPLPPLRSACLRALSAHPTIVTAICSRALRRLTWRLRCLSTVCAQIRAKQVDHLTELIDILASKMKQLGAELEPVRCLLSLAHSPASFTDAANALLMDQLSFLRFEPCADLGLVVLLAQEFASVGEENLSDFRVQAVMARSNDADKAMVLLCRQSHALLSSRACAAHAPRFSPCCYRVMFCIPSCLVVDDALWLLRCPLSVVLCRADCSLIASWLIVRQLCVQIERQAAIVQCCDDILTLGNELVSRLNPSAHAIRCSCNMVLDCTLMPSWHVRNGRAWRPRSARRSTRRLPTRFARAIASDLRLIRGSRC